MNNLTQKQLNACAADLEGRLAAVGGLKVIEKPEDFDRPADGDPAIHIELDGVELGLGVYRR